MLLKKCLTNISIIFGKLYLHYTMTILSQLIYYPNKNIPLYYIRTVIGYFVTRYDFIQVHLFLVVNKLFTLVLT